MAKRCAILALIAIPLFISLEFIFGNAFGYIIDYSRAVFMGIAFIGGYILGASSND